MEKVTVDDLVKMGLGAMLMAKEKVENLVDEAIKQGDISKEQGAQLLDNMKKEAQEKVTETDKTIREEIHKQLKSLGVATKEDIASLRHEITALKHEIQNKQS
jgi:polyhydroxyalkanoate synthesis regulator phasin